MVNNRKNKNKSHKIMLIITVVVLVLAGAGVFVWQDPFNIWRNKDGDYINYDPPTEEEKQAVDDFKDTINTDTPQDEPQPTDPGTKKQVNPFITIAQQFQDMQYGNRVEVRAYIDGIIESDGTCNIVFTKDGQTVTRQIEALPDVSTTICDTTMIPRDKFPQSGTWSVTVAYSSETSEGTSDPFNVEVK